MSKIISHYRQERVHMLLKEQFIFVEYNGLAYPKGYCSPVCEVAGHMDKENIDAAPTYSLHTEYSYGKRNFDTERIARFPSIVEANKDGVPQLWKSMEWASEFADFVIALTREHTAPQIIEIHPPFNDYCTLIQFAERYEIFQQKIHEIYPDTVIVIENRSGTVYRGGRFLVGKAKEIASLCDIIRQQKLDLGIVLDFPQLLTAENIDTLNFKSEKYFDAVETLYPYRDLIKGIHIWGKKKSAKGRWVAHAGNFDTYFEENETSKALFLSGIERICDDGRKRFFVPEVNTGTEDLTMIVKALFGTNSIEFQ